METTQAPERTEPLEAGRELDAAVFSALFPEVRVLPSWASLRFDEDAWPHAIFDRRRKADEPLAFRVYGVEWIRDGVPWHPSEDIAAAWEVVEVMRTKGWIVSVWERDPEHTKGYGAAWGAEFERVDALAWDRPRKASAETAPLAICRAALRAAEAGATREEG